MPWGLIRAGGLAYPRWRELARMSYRWRVPHALDGTALACAVGPLPAADLAFRLSRPMAECIAAVEVLRVQAAPGGT